MAIEILGDGNPDGSSVASGALEKAGFHGVAVVQASAITTVVTLATTATDGPIVVNLNALNANVRALIVAARGKGIVAS